MDSDAIYQQLCSSRTVQSDKKGFFNEFYLEVRETCGEKWLTNYFGKLKSDQARILSIFSDREICDTVLGVLENVKPVFKQKDALFSAQRRAQAEKFNLLGDHNQALAHANLAVARAPGRDVDRSIDGGLTLALAYWTRALILIDMGDGEAALSDLKLAAIYGAESKSSSEYYIKLAQAYAYSGEPARAEISLNIADKISGGGLNKIVKCREEIRNIKPTIKTKAPLEPKIVGDDNKDLHGASTLIKVVEEPDKGKFVVAADNLKTGDVVLFEDPVAACLLPNFFGSHCQHCFEKLKTPVACLKCSGLAFCSSSCMNDACSTYHKFECEYMDLFIGSGMSILCYIALRVFTQAKGGVDEGLSVASELIKTLYNNLESRQPDDFLQRSLMAGFLMRCLQKANYFGRRKTEGVDPTAVELQVASALLGLLQVLQFNAHEIFQTVVTDEHCFEGSKMVYIGAGLYKTGSYFNHECWPTVNRHFVGKRIVLTARQPHKSNQILAENYGPIFTKINTKERQKTLRGRYLFNCSCNCCRENWPLLQKIDMHVRFLCPSGTCDSLLRFPKDLTKDVRCSGCRKNYSLKESVLRLIKCEEKYREAAHAIKDENIQQAIGLFTEAIDEFFQIAVLPHKDTVIAQESLGACWRSLGTAFKK